jgi:uncharacterized protein
MKKTIIAVVAIMTTALLVTSCAPTQSAANNAPQRILSVNATGSVQAQPDIAVINIGVSSKNENVSEALDENTASANAIRQTLEELGVAEEDIQTSNFNVYPQQQQSMPVTPEDPPQSQTVFVVQNTVSITVRELDSIGEILAAVVDEGANTINGINFSLEDPSEAIAEARQKAIADAEEQAQAIADAAGVQLGEITSINISDSSTPTPRTSVVMEQAAGGSVPISSGTLTIQVIANISYGIE